MIVTLATIDEAYAVLSDPRIYETISSDYAPKVEDYEPEPATYLGGFVNDLPIALFVFHPKSALIWQCHIQVIPEYRKDYAKEFAKRGLNWFWSNHQATHLVAEIPSRYPNVIKFSLEHGFKIDGRLENAYIKNRQVFDVYYLSTQREGF